MQPFCQICRVDKFFGLTHVLLLAIVSQTSREERAFTTSDFLLFLHQDCFVTLRRRRRKYKRHYSGEEGLGHLLV